MCKANSVACVKLKVSLAPVRFSRFMANRVLRRVSAKRSVAPGTQKELDIRRHSNIIVFTAAHARPTANQAIPPAPARHAESSSPGRSTRELSGRRILRSGRFAASQVRDAASGGGRQGTGQPGSKSVRLLASVVLSSANSVSGSWPRRPAATETGATIRAQADPRADAVCGASPGSRAGNLQSSTGQSNRTALWHLDSPAQYRSPIATSKKTPVSPQAAAVPLSDRRLVSAYEELRCQAVQGLRRGPGGALMMARGLRCWMEACAQLLAHPDSRTQAPDPPSTSMPSGVRGELIIVLASMLLHRASKGIA
jgi:hypothetical protein